MGSEGGQSQQQSTQQPNKTAFKLFGQTVRTDEGASTPPPEEGSQNIPPTEGQQTPPESGQPPAEGQTPPAQAQPPAPVLSLEAVRELLQQTRQQDQQPPELTQEQFDRMFNVVRPTKDQWNLIRGDDPDQAIAVLTDLLHGAARQAQALSHFTFQRELNSIREAMAPALRVAQERQLEGLKTEFFQTYPNLKGLEPLLMNIRDKFVADRRDFPTKEAAFKAVAEEAERILKTIPGYNGGQQQQQTQQTAGTQQQQSRSMPALSGKGQATGGSSSNSSGSKKMNTAQRIFGPR